MISKPDAERFWAAVHKHASAIPFAALLDMTRALGLQLSVRVIDKKKEPVEQSASSGIVPSRTPGRGVK